MKRIGNAQPLTMVTSYTPLTVGFDISVTGGSTEQFYYTNASQYQPNRSLAPCLLTPRMSIVNPDSGSSSEVTSGLEVTWYENNKDTVISTGDYYTVNANGTLTVKKNVPLTGILQIICVAKYTDPRTGMVYLREKSIPFSLVMKTDTALYLSWDIPEVCTFNVLDDSTLRTITATARLGTTVLTDDQVKFFWYLVTANGVETLINPGADVNMLEFISLTNSVLQVNNMYVNKTRIRLKAALKATSSSNPSAPDNPNYWIESTLSWLMSGKITAYAKSPTGDMILASETSKTFKCGVNVGGRELTDIEITTHFYIEWYSLANTSGATRKLIGGGLTCTVPASQLRTTNWKNTVDVVPDVYERGPYKAVVSGGKLVMSDGKAAVFR